MYLHKKDEYDDEIILHLPISLKDMAQDQDTDIFLKKIQTRLGSQRSMQNVFL
jgi:hypothetical protein